MKFQLTAWLGELTFVTSGENIFQGFVISINVQKVKGRQIMLFNVKQFMVVLGIQNMESQ